MGVLVGLLSVACVGLVVVVVVAQRRRIDELTAALGGSPGDDVAPEVITIEIRNHAEVATNRTVLAKPLAALTPGLLRGIVQRETVKMMRSELAENGVVADVRLRRLAGGGPATPPPDTEHA